jgi:hypothetical protein
MLELEALHSTVWLTLFLILSQETVMQLEALHSEVWFTSYLNLTHKTMMELEHSSLHLSYIVIPSNRNRFIFHVSKNIFIKAA